MHEKDIEKWKIFDKGRLKMYEWAEFMFMFGGISDWKFIWKSSDLFWFIYGEFTFGFLKENDERLSCGFQICWMSVLFIRFDHPVYQTHQLQQIPPIKKTFFAFDQNGDKTFPFNHCIFFGKYCTICSS